jgi:hypothetical protein
MLLPMPRNPVASPLGGLMVVVMLAVAMPSLYRIRTSRKEPGARGAAQDAARPSQDNQKALEAFLETYRLAPGRNLKDRRFNKFPVS